MKAFVCFSALLVAASARPQLVAHAPAVAVAHAPVAIAHAPVLAHAAPLIRAHPVAHAVAGYAAAETVPTYSQTFQSMPSNADPRTGFG